MRIEWWRKHRTHTDVTNTFCECEHTPDQGTALNTHRVQQGGSCTAGERGERVQLCTVDLISRPNHIPIPSRDWWFTVRFGTQSEQVSPCRSRDMSRDSFVLCCVCCVPVLRRERSWERSWAASQQGQLSTTGEAPLAFPCHHVTRELSPHDPDIIGNFNQVWNLITGKHNMSFLSVFLLFFLLFSLCFLWVFSVFS